MRLTDKLARTVLLLCSPLSALDAQAVPVSLRAGAAWNSNRPASPTASLDVERPLSGPTAIRIELAYVPRGLTDSAQTCTIAGVCFMNGVDVKTEFISFAALFVLSDNQPFIPFLAAGPYLATRIGCRSVTVGDCGRVDTSDGGIVVETGVMLTARPPVVSLGLRYERAIAATVQIPATDAGGSHDLRYQTLSVTLRLRLGSFGTGN